MIRGVGVANGVGDLVEAGAVEVEGDGSKPFKRNQVCLNYSQFVDRIRLIPHNQVFLCLC